MRSVILKYTILTFIFALLLNAALPILPVFSVTKETGYKELSKVFGNKIIICTSSNAAKHYVSSFERLDQEQHQKLKKHIDVAFSFPTSPDSKYINDVYSAHVAAIHSGAIKPFTIPVKPETFQLSLKFSTAPPHIS